MSLTGKAPPASPTLGELLRGPSAPAGIERLGDGGMGVVFRVDAIGGSFAVKACLDPHALANPGQTVARYLALRDIRHDRLVRYLDAMTVDLADLAQSWQLARRAEEAASGKPWPERVPFVLMSLVPGTPLHRRCRWVEAAQRERRTPVFVAALRDVAEGLAYLHNLHALHRDVTAGNILVDEQGRATLIDLEMLLRGEARGPVRAPASLSGTLQSIAPECLETGHSLDPRVDVYSLGIVAYEFFTGMTAFPPADVEEIARLKRLPVTPARFHRPELSAGIDELLGAALHPDPSRRHPSAPAFVDALEQVCFSRTTSGVIRTLLPGRKALLQQMRRSLPENGDAAFPAVSFLTGAKGSGRSLLLGALRQDALRAGMIVASGSARAATTGRRSGFSLVLRLVLHAYESLWLPLPDLFRLCGALLPRFFPGLQGMAEFRGLPGVAELQPHEEEQRLGDLINQLLRTLASSHRVVLIIDDAEHLSGLEVQLLRMLLRTQSTPHSPAWRGAGETPSFWMVLGVETDTLERSRLAAFHRAHRGEDSERTFQVEALSFPEVVELIEEVAGVPRVPLELADTIWTRSQGLPSRVKALMNELFDAHAIRVSDTRVDLVADRWKSFLNASDPRTRQPWRALPEPLLAWARRLAFFHDGFSRSAMITLYPAIAPDLDRLLQLGREQGWLLRPSGEWWLFASPEVARQIRADCPAEESAAIATEISAILLNTEDQSQTTIAASQAAEIHQLARRRVEAFRDWVRAGGQSRDRLDYDEALSSYRTGARLLESFTPDELEQVAAQIVTLIKGLGMLYYARGERDQAVDVYRRLGGLCRGDQKVEIAIEGLSVAFSSFAESGDLATAESYAWQAISFARESGNALVLARSLVKTASLLLRSGNEAESMRSLQEAILLLSGTPEHKTDLAVALNGLGTLLRRRGDLHGAEKCFSDASTVMNQSGEDAIRLGMALHNWGLCLEELGEFEQAEAKFQDANERFLQVGYLQGSATALNSLGNLALERGTLEPAREYFTRARDLYHDLQDIQREAMCLNNLGEVLLVQGDFEGAGRALDKALAYRREQRSPKVLYSLAYLAALRSAQGRPEEGLALLGGLDEAGIVEARLRLLYLLERMRLHDAMGQFEAARECFQRAAQTTTSSADAAMRGVLLVRWAGIARRSGDGEEALRALAEAESLPAVRANRLAGLLLQTQRALLDRSETLDAELTRLQAEAESCGARLIAEEIARESRH